MQKVFHDMGLGFGVEGLGVLGFGFSSWPGLRYRDSRPFHMKP